MVGPKGGAITPWPSPKYATDVCHMLKLLRNTFASQTMVDGDGHQIKWTYIEELHKQKYSALDSFKIGKIQQSLA